MWSALKQKVYEVPVNDFQSLKRSIVQALVHVSSTYTQADKPVVDEILYPSEFDWKQTITIAESIDEDTLKTLTAKYMGAMPNTYTFSKRLAEQVIGDYSESLPCVIIRPSIVIATSHDPVEGWIDNFNGPIGMLVGGGKGILRVVCANKNVISDFMPVDALVKAIIIIAWKRGIKIKDNVIDVYNCSSSQMKPMNIHNIVQIGLDLTRDVPLDNIIWKPQTTITNSYLMYYILVLLLHILPAILLDTIMKLFGIRPILFRLQRKVYVTNSALSYFLLNEWKFHNAKLIKTFDTLSADNKKKFGYPYESIDMLEYFKNGIIGSKIYLLNEKVDDLEPARRHYVRMEWIDIITKTLFVVFILWIFYRKNMFSYITDIFSSLTY